jgi:hypothetical protein
VSVSSQLGRGSTFVYRMACAQHDKDYGKDLDVGFSG